MLRLVILFVFAVFLMCSCQSVKPYQRAYLNDRDMQFGDMTVEEFELRAHAYREGAAGAGKGKSSGGCGCK